MRIQFLKTTITTLRTGLTRNPKPLFFIIAALLVFSSIGYIYKDYQSKQKFEQERLATEVAKNKESEANKVFLIDVVDSLSELDTAREKILLRDGDITTQEIGKILEVAAHRGYINMSKYISSEYRQIQNTSMEISDVVEQLEDYGARMNASPSKDYSDIGVMLNDLPDNLRIVVDLLYEEKLNLTEMGKSEVVLRLNLRFKDELTRYEKYLISRSEKDFVNFFSEDITAVFMFDVLAFGHVRISK